jgi:hypothetical protein
MIIATVEAPSSTSKSSSSTTIQARWQTAVQPGLSVADHTSDGDIPSPVPNTEATSSPRTCKVSFDHYKFLPGWDMDGDELIDLFPDRRGSHCALPDYPDERWSESEAVSKVILELGRPTGLFPDIRFVSLISNLLA